MVGVGDISGIYLKNLSETFKEIELVAVCDLVKEKALAAKEKYNIPKIYDTMYELFDDEEIDIVLNLTRPYEHYEVSRQALLHGKNVYSGKPLAATFEEAKACSPSRRKNLMIGGAPDTFLGAGIQTCRKLIEDGVIGDLVGSAAFMICRGHESWHPDPEFYYKHGGGPMMDMGPYYVTALINLMGGVKREALAGLHRDTRVVHNRLPPERWRGLKSLRQQGRRPRVGWAGGTGHQGDLEVIADVVKALAGEVDSKTVAARCSCSSAITRSVMSRLVPRVPRSGRATSITGWQTCSIQRSESSRARMRKGVRRWPPGGPPFSSWPSQMGRSSGWMILRIRSGSPMKSTGP